MLKEALLFPECFGNVLDIISVHITTLSVHCEGVNRKQTVRCSVVGKTMWEELSPKNAALFCSKTTPTCFLETGITFANTFFSFKGYKEDIFQISQYKTTI